MASEATARLVLAAAEDGGLRQSLITPTPSLVFRPAGAEDIGLAGVIHLPDDAPLEAGTVVEARVVFPMDDADPFVIERQRFVLWNGRTVGTADVTEVIE